MATNQKVGSSNLSGRTIFPSVYAPFRESPSRGISHEPLGAAVGLPAAHLIHSQAGPEECF